MRNYTATGYAEVGKAPAAVVTSLTHFYHKHQNKLVREAWPPGHIYANHWESVMKILPVEGFPHEDTARIDTTIGGGDGRSSGAQQQPVISAQKRREIIALVQSILEKWCKAPLVPMSVQGIREYRRGAIVAPSVNRLPFVISAIINVAQNVVDDWPLQVIAHDGKAVNLTMLPGDMVSTVCRFFVGMRVGHLLSKLAYYLENKYLLFSICKVILEGASVVHGRPYPLNGATYSEIQLHFEPAGYSQHHTARLRQDPKKLFEAALQKELDAAAATGGRLHADSKKQIHMPYPYYIPPKYSDQWDQKYVFVKRPTSQRKKPKTVEDNLKKIDNLKSMSAGGNEKKESGTNVDENEYEVDGRLFHDLASKGYLVQMKKLVADNPAIVNKVDKNGWTALHEAARSGHTRGEY